MAKLIIDQVEYDTPDGSRIQGICEEAGVPFSCNTGVCGSCMIRVVEGNDNLEGLTDEEKDLGLDQQSRLACQCVLKSGTVSVTY